MTDRMEEIHNAQLNWEHDPICRISDTDTVRYTGIHADVEQSRDGGVSWSRLPWKLSFASRILRWLSQSEWPPFIECFGSYQGQIAIAWHANTESEMNIGKYLAVFDQSAQTWKIRYLGFYNLEDGVQLTWFENIGFDAFNRMRPR